MQALGSRECAWGCCWGSAEKLPYLTILSFKWHNWWWCSLGPECLVPGRRWISRPSSTKEGPVSLLHRAGKTKYLVKLHNNGKAEWDPKRGDVCHCRALLSPASFIFLYIISNFFLNGSRLPGAILNFPSVKCYFGHLVGISQCFGGCRSSGFSSVPVGMERFVSPQV